MKRLLFSVVIGALLLVGVAGQVALARQRPGATAAMDESVIATLGGFRSLAAEVIWFRADRLQDEGRFGELVQLATMLTYLEPHDTEVWSYAAWNLAYNISVRMPREEDRWPWVHQGLRLLRDQGLRWNPREADLYRELAFLFELKMGVKENDTAAPLYQAEWRKIVEDVRARNAWEELAMEPEKMAEVERVYGVSDWTSPFASALYWAHQGLPYAAPRQKIFLNEAIRQSKNLYDKGN